MLKVGKNELYEHNLFAIIYVTISNVMPIHFFVHPCVPAALITLRRFLILKDLYAFISAVPQLGCSCKGFLITIHNYSLGDH